MIKKILMIFIAIISLHQFIYAQGEVITNEAMDGFSYDKFANEVYFRNPYRGGLWKVNLDSYEMTEAPFQPSGIPVFANKNH